MANGRTSDVYTLTLELDGDVARAFANDASTGPTLSDRRYDLLGALRDFGMVKDFRRTEETLLVEEYDLNEAEAVEEQK